MSSGSESACGVTSRFAPRLRNSRAKRSPTSSDTLSAAVATAIPKARAAKVSSLRLGRRVKESVTSRKNIDLQSREQLTTSSEQESDSAEQRSSSLLPAAPHYRGISSV